MSHGYPDYGVGAEIANIHRVTDLGELAVRLGSPSFFDRRGYVFWYDDMESGINRWEITTAGSGSKVETSPDYKLSGGYSMMLYAGIDGTPYAQAIAYSPYPVLSKIGLEAAIAFGGAPLYIRMDLHFHDGSWWYSYNLRWFPTSGLVQILDDSGNYATVLTSEGITDTPQLFNIIKLVVDPQRGHYHRLILNSSEVDLSAYGCLAAESPIHPYIRCVFLNVGDGVNACPVYVDNVILTQQEPA